MDELNVNVTVDEETADMNEEKAEIKSNLFTKIINTSKAGVNVITGFIKNIFTNKSNETSGETNPETEKMGFFARMKSKVKNFMSGKVDYTKGEDAIRSSGLSAILAYRAAVFVKKIMKKFNKKIDSEKSPKFLAKVIHMLIKVLAIAVTVMFGVAFASYFVKLLPVIFAAVAKVVAVAAIIEVVFYLVGMTTNAYPAVN